MEAELITCHARQILRNVLKSTVIWYRPFASFVLSLRPQSFVNVGRPAVRIQFWKCSSALRFGGGVLFEYPFGKRTAQLGGGVMRERSYVSVAAYFFDSPGHAMPVSDHV